LKDVPAKEIIEKMLTAHTTGMLVIRDWGHYMPTSSNDKVYDYLHLVKAIDIDAWLETQGVDYRFPKAEQPLNGKVADSSLGAVTPIQRTAAQNAAILAAIKNKGYQANSLPKRTPGKSGVKALIRAAVATNRLFQGRVFDKTWERLRSSGEIADAI
jgi:hypothetical protein